MEAWMEYIEKDFPVPDTAAVIWVSKHIQLQIQLAAFAFPPYI